MKLSNFKIVILTLLASAMFVLSGCGSSGTASDRDLVGSTPSLSISAPTHVFSQDDVRMDAIVNVEGDYTLLWTQKGGMAISLDDATSLSPSFIAPDINGSSIIEMEALVTKEDHTTISERVFIELFSAHLIIDAGHPRDVASNHQVSLHGSANIDDGHTSLEIIWSQVDDNNISVALMDADTFNPIFTSPNVQNATLLVFNLHVVSKYFTRDATVTITVLPTAVTTVAPSTPIISHPGSTVNLGSNVLPPNSNHTHTHQWTQVSGPTVTITTPTAPTTSFVVPAVTTTPVVVQHTLTTTPNNGATPTTTVTKHHIKVVAPTPVAAPLHVVVTTPVDMYEGESRILHVSASGGDGSYTYAWSITAGNAFATLDTTDPQNPVLKANAVTLNEIVVLQVLTTDASGAKDTQTISLAVKNASFSVSTWGNLRMIYSHTAHLHATPTGTPLYNPISYVWSEVNGSSVTINDINSDNPSVSAVDSGSYTLEVEATDSLNNIARDTVSFDVVDTLTVDAGKDRTVNEDTNVSLHGSTAGGFGITSIVWTWGQGSGSPAVSFTLHNDDTLNPFFVTPHVTVTTRITFFLEVTDAKGRVLKDEVDIFVDPILPTVSISAPTSAPQGSDINAFCDVQGGLAPLSIEWTIVPNSDITLTSHFDDKNASIHISSSATSPVKLTCTVWDKDNNIVAATSSTLAPYTVPPVSALTVKTSNSTSIRENEIAMLSAHATGGTAPYTYKWEKTNPNFTGTINTPNQANASYTPVLVTDSGFYLLEIRVTVTDAAGATASKHHLLRVDDIPLKISISGPDTVKHLDKAAYTSTVSGGSGHYTYSWNGGLGKSDTYTLDTIFFKPGSSIVKLTVTDTLNGTTQTVSVQKDIVITDNPFAVTNLDDDLRSATYNGVGDSNWFSRPGGVLMRRDVWGNFSVLNVLPNEILTSTIIETSGTIPAVLALDVILQFNHRIFVECTVIHDAVPTKKYTFEITVIGHINGIESRRIVVTRHLNVYL